MGSPTKTSISTYGIRNDAATSTHQGALERGYPVVPDRVPTPQGALEMGHLERQSSGHDGCVYQLYWAKSPAGTVAGATRRDFRVGVFVCVPEDEAPWQVCSPIVQKKKKKNEVVQAATFLCTIQLLALTSGAGANIQQRDSKRTVTQLSETRVFSRTVGEGNRPTKRC